MKQLIKILEGIGSVVQLLTRSLSYAGTLPRQWARFVEQCYMIGYTTLPIVAILSFFIGSVLALEAGYSMSGFGAKEFIGSLVGLSMARELGPMMVAILLAGRVGSAITAELSSMRGYQEIDALETMNIPPARVLGGRPPGLEPRQVHRPRLPYLLRRAPAVHEVQGRGQRPVQGRGLRLRGG